VEFYVVQVCGRNFGEFVDGGGIIDEKVLRFGRTLSRLEGAF
jgi:hypothetical protein